jgi:hypothetical protein
MAGDRSDLGLFFIETVSLNEKIYHLMIRTALKKSVFFVEGGRAGQVISQAGIEQIQDSNSRDGISVVSAHAKDKFEDDNHEIKNREFKSEKEECYKIARMSQSSCFYINIVFAFFVFIRIKT